MKIDQYNSQKIKILSFVLIVMVVYIHSYYLEAENKMISNSIQLFGGALTSVAVPLFYVISGFLFFNGISSIIDCFPRIKKRIYTLFIPYLIWNLVFVLWYVVLTFLPGASQYINSDILDNLSIERPLDALCFLFIRPAGFQMWFVRDLILFTMFSPVLYISIKHTKWITFIILLLLTGWMTRFWITSFAIGGIIAVVYDNGLDAFRCKRKCWVVISIVIYLGYSIMSAMGFTTTQYEIVNRYIVQLFTIILLIAIWGGYDLWVKQDYVASKTFCTIMNYTFFIYLFHEPAFNIVKKLGLKVIGDGDLQLSILYIINPWIMVSIAVVVGYIFQRLFPKFYSISVGGR